LRYREAMTKTIDLDATVDTYLAALTEADAGWRAELIRTVWADDCELTDPAIVARGWPGISQLAAVVLVEFPGYAFRRSGAVVRAADHVCFAWEFMGPGGSVALRGIDVGKLSDDGRLRRISRRYGR
jgi:hypothetical protein